MTTPTPPAASDAKPRSRAPDTYLLLLAIALLAFAATYITPHGVFETVTSPDGRERLDPGTYAVAPDAGGAPLYGSAEDVGLASFLFEGLVSGDRYSATVGLLAFLIIIGGAFGMILRTGAVDRALMATILANDQPSERLIVVLFVAFSLGGAVFGMAEEAIIFCLIVIPALVRAGYDSITGLLCVFGGSQVGFAASWMNPFNVIVAQGIADVPPLSGLEFRVVMWLVFTGLGALYLYAYARRVRLKPETSPTRGTDQSFRDEAPEDHGEATFSAPDALVLAIVAAGIGWVAWGVGAQGYYLAEIGAQFFVIGAACAIVGRVFGLNGVTGNDLMEAFRQGAMQMLPAAIVVAAAKGVVLLLGGDDPTTPSVLNTALHHAGGFTQALPTWASAWGMLGVQSLINVAVVSGSGQAALTMPLMAPLADISGVSRQTAVVAFQLGDGVTNLIVPASAVLLGCLGAARTDWVTWARFAWRPTLYLMILASVFVLSAQAIGLS